MKELPQEFDQLCECVLALNDGDGVAPSCPYVCTDCGKKRNVRRKELKMSTRTRYGLRALITIARNSDIVVSSELISNEQKISKKYLDRLLSLLRRGKLIKSVKGKAGGYILARPPENITLREMFVTLEGPFTLAPCTIDPNQCKYTGNCVAHRIWIEVAEAFSATLEKVTLKQMIDREFNDTTLCPHNVAEAQKLTNLEDEEKQQRKARKTV